MGRKLVLAGAGHAHMVVLENISKIIERGHSVTVIGPDDRHYYSGMGPGMLGGTYSAEEICFESRGAVDLQGGTFIKDKVQSIDGVKRLVHLESGRNVEYDILSCNCGSFVTHNYVSTKDCPVYSVKPIENLLAARERICQIGKGKPLRIGIIGGGPSAAEIAGNVLQLVEEKSLANVELHIFCRGRFMSRFSGKVQQACRDFLIRSSVRIGENDAVSGLEDGIILTESGRCQPVDMVFAAKGVTPSKVFRNSGIKTGSDGGLAVNRYLQSVEYPEIFGGGDCIFFEPGPLDKVGVYAVRQNPVLYNNLTAALDRKKLTEFDPGGHYLLIFNLGRRYGVLQKGSLFWKGRLAYMIKDYIDRKFMKTYQ